MTIQRCTGFQCWTGAIQLWFKIRATATLSNWNTELHTFSLFKAFTPPRSPVVCEDLHFEMSKSFSHFSVYKSTFTFWRQQLKVCKSKAPDLLCAVCTVCKCASVTRPEPGLVISSSATPGLISSSSGPQCFVTTGEVFQCSGVHPTPGFNITLVISQYTLQTSGRTTATTLYILKTEKWILTQTVTSGAAIKNKTNR